MFLLNRHRNLSILATLLLAQMLGLAFQVKRPTDHGPVRVIRIWASYFVTPLEQLAVHMQRGALNLWSDYVYLRQVHSENQRLSEENLRLRLEQVRLAQDAGQAQRLQALLSFKEQFISRTIAAQVIGTSGSESSRLIFIDKGADDGVKPGMAVIAPTGIVGKVIIVSGPAAQVLEISDQLSGVGAMLEKSRVQGIVKGSTSGETIMHYVMADEKVDSGEMVVTSGGDGIFPKGLPIGTVTQVGPGLEAFLNIRVKPAAQLDRLEEVLVITTVDREQPDLAPEAPMRAADILAQRLPGVPAKPPDEQSAPAADKLAQPVEGAKAAPGNSRGTAANTGSDTSLPAANRQSPQTFAKEQKIPPDNGPKNENH
ncbi:MAG: rod shape-determining protein MreC [Terriglobales bacterium]|jgi:rod shape-determining protein MreC